MADFDRVAAWYLPAERLALGWWLERTREFFLPEAATRRQAVLFGDGDGRFAARLLARAPAMQAVVVDGSAAMLRLLERRCRAAGVGERVRPWHGDARGWPTGAPTRRPDLIVSHFFLDCLADPDLASLAQRLAAVAEPGCLWLVSDFATPRREPWKTLGSAYIRLLYQAFGVLTGLPLRTLPAMGPALRAAGFVELRRREFLGGLLFTSLWRLHTTPAAAAIIHLKMTDTGVEPVELPPAPATQAEPEDPVPDPEPEVPSLPTPDPGVFGHGA